MKRASQIVCWSNAFNTVPAKQLRDSFEKHAPPLSKFIKMQTMDKKEKPILGPRDHFVILPRIFDHLDGLRLKKQGALYLIPSHSVTALFGIRAALEPSGLNLIFSPATRDTGTVIAITDSLNDKAAAIKEAITSYIETGRARPSTLKKISVRFDHLVEIKEALAKEFGMIVKTGTKLSFVEAADLLTSEESRIEKPQPKKKSKNAKPKPSAPEISISPLESSPQYF